MAIVDETVNVMSYWFVFIYGRKQWLEDNYNSLL